MRSWVGFASALLLCQTPAVARDLPHLQRNGAAIQLIVDGEPYVALAGELHNSSASSPRYMAPIWDQLARDGLNTVIGTASWNLVEPREGQFDFTAVDDEIRQAHGHGLRLVLIWFGAYKNAESSYAPSWVRRDQARFPRARRDPAFKATGAAAYMDGPVLTVFNDRLADADAHAFAALMHHIRQVDSDNTVIMMQVENETGMMGTARDRAPLADAAWVRPVPASLLRYLHDHRATLRPELAQAWARQGYRERGTWADVFGSDATASEIFMAWGFGQYVDRVARAGAAEYPLPMYTNTWLGPEPGETRPGDWPSGGPVAHMLDVWKAAAPSLALLAPDIYVDDYAGTLTQFRRADNPIFNPEVKFDPGNLFVALGAFNAIGFSPFGIEDAGENDGVFKAYRVLRTMIPQIARAQAFGQIRGFRMGGAGPEKVILGGYDFTMSRMRGMDGAFGPGTTTQASAKVDGYGPWPWGRASRWTLPRRAERSRWTQWSKARLKTGN